MTLETQLGSIVKGALPHLSNEEVRDIATYLMSEDVGVVCLADLKDLTLELMPQSIPRLKQRQLWMALTKESQPTTSAGEGTSTSETSNQTPPQPQQRRPAPMSTNFSGSQSKPDYQFKVVWNDMPQTTLQKLDQANKKKETADPVDISDLKLAIAKKMVSSYVAFREVNPGCQLSPGRTVYTDVTKQVFSRLDECLKVKVNGKVIGKGDHTFNYILEVCTDNLLRKYREKNRTRVTARKGKGTVGVLPNEYEPRPINEEEQKGIKTHLQNYFLLDAREQDLQQVRTDLAQTYELQRADIITAKAEVLEHNVETNENDDDDDQDLSEPAMPAMKNLLKQWPFLFRPENLRLHHNRLTGRDIHLEISKFVQEKMETLLLYMTTSSNSNIANMALRLNAEANDAGNRLIMALIMVANHFKNDPKLLIFNAERTLRLDELHLDQSEPCIVVFGNDPISAQKFVVCADKVPLITCDSEIDAVTSLFEACFVFDLEYPKLPQTVEFFERYVFSMGFSDTRVENKKGRLLLTITDAVKRLINGLQTFEEELRKEQEGNTE